MLYCCLAMQTTDSGCKKSVDEVEQPQQQQQQQRDGDVAKEDAAVKNGANDDDNVDGEPSTYVIQAAEVTTVVARDTGHDRDQMLTRSVLF